MSNRIRHELPVALDLADFYVWISLRRGSWVETSRWRLAIGLPMLARAAVISPVAVGERRGGEEVQATLSLTAGRPGLLPTMSLQYRAGSATLALESAAAGQSLLAEVAELVRSQSGEHAA